MEKPKVKPVGVIEEFREIGVGAHHYPWAVVQYYKPHEVEHWLFQGIERGIGNGMFGFPFKRPDMYVVGMHGEAVQYRKFIRQFPFTTAPIREIPWKVT